MPFEYWISFQILESDWTPPLMWLHIAVTTEKPVALRFDFVVGNAVQSVVETVDHLELVVCIGSDRCCFVSSCQFKNISPHPCDFATVFWDAWVLGAPDH